MTYKNATTGEIRELDAEMVAMWTATSNPKRLVWRPYQATTPPAFNAATQKAVPAADLDSNGTLTQQWAIVPLNAAELEIVADAEEATQLKAAIAVFDNRTATNNQIQRAIAYLLKHL